MENSRVQKGKSDLDIDLHQYNLTSYTVNLIWKDTVYLVKSKEGEFILKRVLNDNGRLDRMFEEHQLLNYLYEMSVPVAYPLKTKNGCTYLEADNYLYVLTPKIPNDGADFFSQSHSIYTDIGRSIAHFHKAIATYPNTLQRWNVEPYNTLYQDIAPELKKYLHENECEKITKILIKLKGEMRETFNGLPTQRIHGDCHPGNVCVSHNKVTGYVDCDHFPVGPRIFDVCYYLIHIIKWHLDDNVKVKLFLSHYLYMLRAYNSIIPLTIKDKRAFWYMLLYIQLLFFKFKMSCGDEQGFIDLKAFWWVYNNRENLSI